MRISRILIMVIATTIALASCSSETATEATSSSGSEEVPADGYTIEVSNDLSAVCEAQSYPTGIDKTATGDIGLIFQQQDSEAPYYQVPQGEADLSGGLDWVICLDATDEVAFTMDCTFEDGTFPLEGNYFDANVYDLQSKELVGSGRLTHKERCPAVALTENGKVVAADVELEPLNEILAAIS